jgi:hypothetical protein
MVSSVFGIQAIGTMHPETPKYNRTSTERLRGGKYPDLNLVLRKRRRPSNPSQSLEKGAVIRSSQCPSEMIAASHSVSQTAGNYDIMTLKPT